MFKCCSVEYVVNSVHSIFNRCKIAHITDEELNLVTDINGYNMETLNMVVYARTAYNDIDQLEEDLNDGVNIMDILCTEGYERNH